MQETINQSEIVKVLGERAKYARTQLNSLAQGDASKKLGLTSQSALCKIETGNVANVQLQTIRAMSALYDVSCDFLLGLSDDWEPDVPRAANQHLIDLMDRCHRQSLKALADLESKVQAIMGLNTDLGKAVTEVMDAYDRVKDHPAFEDLPASRLDNRLSNLRELSKHSRTQANRYRQTVSVAAVDTLPLDLGEGA